MEIFKKIIIIALVIGGLFVLADYAWFNRVFPRKRKKAALPEPSEAEKAAAQVGEAYRDKEAAAKKELLDFLTELAKSPTTQNMERLEKQKMIDAKIEELTSTHGVQIKIQY